MLLLIGAAFFMLKNLESHQANHTIDTLFGLGSTSIS